MKKKKSRSGCLVVIILFLLIGSRFGSIETKTVTPSATATKAAVTATPTVTTTKQPTTEPTIKPTATPTTEPTAEPLVIYLRYPELGEYGRYYTFNATVEKATKEDMNTVIQCFVPVGTYTLTNEGKYPTFVYVYSEETQITSAGWEEPADGWVSKMLQVGDSCETTIEEGYYIKLLDNDTFKLVQNNTK